MRCTNTSRWAAVLFFSMASVQAAGIQILKGHVPEAVSASKAVGQIPPATQLRLAVGLPLRNQADLDNLLKQLADPASPNFRQYLTPAQFAERFGPTAEDYQALAAFFRGKRLFGDGHAPQPHDPGCKRYGGGHRERTFHVNMMYWSHPTRGTFFAPDREPIGGCRSDHSGHRGLG